MRLLLSTLTAALIMPALLSMALADEDEQWLSAGEVSALLDNVSLVGTANGRLWYECVSNAKTTVYKVEGGSIQYGKVFVTQEGAACFNYGGPDNCFLVQKEGENYAFHNYHQQIGLLNSTVFITHEVHKGRDICTRTDVS